MGIRINPDLYSTMLAGVMVDQKEENTAETELSTGQKVNQPSDDPAAVAAFIGNNSQTSKVNSYLSNISTLTGSMQMADSTLNSVVTSLSQAISLGIEGANSTENQTDRNAIAQQVSGIQQQILQYANQSFQGNYLFAGTAAKTQPYVTDPASPSGVSYVGNAGVNNVEIGDGQAVPTNLPGSKIFDAPGADVFQALSDLTSALQSGNNIATAQSELENAFNNVNTQLTFYGTTLSRLNTATTFLNQENIQLSQENDNLVGANMASVISDLTQSETTMQATLEAGGQISQLSLFNYMQH